MEIKQDNPQNESIESTAQSPSPPSAAIFTQPISKVKNEVFVNQRVKILARIQSMSEPYPFEQNTLVDLVLCDRDDNSIECLPTDPAQYSEIFERNKFVVFEGLIISDDEYKFQIIEVDERVKAEDLIYVRHYSTVDPTLTDLLGRLLHEGKIFEYIKETLVRELGIQGLDSAVELNKAIDFMIYQAFSYGKSGNASMRLHSLVIGSPGSGKKLLTDIAMAINPVAQEISAADGKVTLAGLIGNVVKQKTRTTSKPGYFSLASGGTLCIQDFHSITKNRSAVLSSFAKVMEDGEVIDSTSARTIHTAETSIHLDTNKHSQVRKSDTENSLKDIDIPLNVITRFDFIIDIAGDADRQTRVMEAISERTITLDSFSQYEEDNPKLRQLKRLIAYLISNTQKVTITRDIAKYKTEQLKRMKAEYDEKIKDMNSWQGLFTRLANSMNKYLKAIATSRFTNKLTPEDVDLAISFIRPKLDFISTLQDLLVSGTDPSTARKNLICTQFKGKTVNKNEIQTYLKENGFDVNMRTVDRDLKELEDAGMVKKAKQAHWEIL